MADQRVLLVTGGTGFVGRAVVAQARAAGWRVLVASRQADARDPDQRAYELGRPVEDALLAGVSHVIHAAYVKAGEVPDAFQTNVAAGQALLDAAQRAGVERCVLVSSFSAGVDARSVYGRQKAALEERFTAAEQGFVRLGLVLGNGGVAGAMAAHVKRWRALPVLGDGLQPVQTVHVEDAARALVAALGAKAGGPWNVAEQDAVPYRTFCRLLARTVGVRAVLVPVPERPLALLVRVAKRLHVPVPVSSESIQGLAALRAWDTSTSVAALGITVRRCEESLAALGAAGLLGA